MSEKSEPETEVVEASKWPLPYNIGIDKLDMIVKAFFQAGADKQKVSVNDLLGRTGLNANTIKGNVKFLSAVGILKVEEKDSCLLDGKGAEYAKALATGDDKTYPTILKELLTDSYLRELIGYVELQKSSGLTFEQLFQHIKGMARLTEDPKYGPTRIAPPYRTGITALVDLLVRAGIVSQEVVAKKETTRTKASSQATSRPRAKKAGPDRTHEESEDTSSELPKEVLARFILSGTGHVDVKDKDDFEIAKAYWKALSRKLGLTEKET